MKRKPDPILTICVVAFVLSLVGLLWVPIARSAPPSGADLNSPLGRWFAGVTHPTLGSCCGFADGTFVRAWIAGGQWHVEDKGQTFVVPDQAVILGTASPDGRPVAWFTHGREHEAEIKCFVPPSES